jgi:hypothetical protein
MSRPARVTLQLPAELHEHSRFLAIGALLHGMHVSRFEPHDLQSVALSRWAFVVDVAMEHGGL